MGERVAGQEFSGRERARTAAMMRFTAEQLRRAAARMQCQRVGGAQRKNGSTLRALGDAVLVQADAIAERTGRLARPVDDGAEMPRPAADDERPLVLTGRDRVEGSRRPG